MTNKEKYAEDLHSIFLNSFGVDKENKPFSALHPVVNNASFIIAK